jgi:hypothetical protein
MKLSFHLSVIFGAAEITWTASFPTNRECLIARSRISIRGSGALPDRIPPFPFQSSAWLAAASEAFLLLRFFASSFVMDIVTTAASIACFTDEILTLKLRRSDGPAAYVVSRLSGLLEPVKLATGALANRNRSTGECAPTGGESLPHALPHRRLRERASKGINPLFRTRSKF